LPALAEAAPVAADFNGDGFADLAIGTPGEGLQGRADVGAVTVLFGSGAGGLSAEKSRVLTPDDWGIAAPAGSQFGTALAAGDFNKDGYADLAIGAPLQASGAGRLYIVFGSAAGLGRTGGPYRQGYFKGNAESGDRFASALAAGDFDGDGYADLGIGVPGEDIRTAVDAGEVDVGYGSKKGLHKHGDAWHQNTPTINDSAEPGDRFGAALAAADFGHGRFDDLAIGVPGENLPGGADAGAVAILFGTSGRGLTPRDNQLWHQNVPGVQDDAEAGDAFGAALAASDFGGQSEADLAIGVPGEDLGTVSDAGAVAVLYGDASEGLRAQGNQLWTQDSADVADETEAGDRFGTALAAGFLNGDAHSELAIGVPDESVGSTAGAGVVNVLYGTGAGLAAAGNQLWSQDVPNIEEQSEGGDGFGAALAIAAFGGSGQPGVAVGVPGEDRAAENGGGVNVIYGGPAGLATGGNQFWDQDSIGIDDSSESGDRFGSALAPGH
jgi:hypothetical protein